MNIWKVTTNVRTLYVNAPNEETAAQHACDIELCPRISIVTVEPYNGERV